MILTVNGGSSSLKFALFHPGEPPERALFGRFERIGTPDACLVIRKETRPVDAPDHKACVPLLLDLLGEVHPGAVAHRIVHGGPDYFDPALVDDKLLDELRRFSDFVPEHLPAEIELIEALQEHFGDVPHVACFDTGFHKDMPRLAQLLPIPRHYFDKGIRKYGFHGLSYSWLLRELRRLGGEKEAMSRVILAHLGNGCSMAAVREGRCLDTTMSFTPAAGLVMSRRSGDLDPGLVAYLARTEGMSAEDFNGMVNTKAGLLGISDTTSDVRDLLARRDSDPRAAEAIDLFCYHAQRWIGALASVCRGLDTLVFAGGIGENASAIRAQVCSGLCFLGIELDGNANQSGADVISSESSRVKVRVIRTDEELYMATCTLPFLSR